MEASQYGHDTEVFLDERIKELVCPICRLVPRAPRLNGVADCGHLFCAPCCDSYISSPQFRNACPVCRRKMTRSSVVSDYNTARFITTGRVRCPHAVAGQPCDWQDKFGPEGVNVQEHLISCPFERVKCIYDGCDAVYTNAEMGSHRQDCQYRAVACVRCGGWMQFADMALHDDSCPESVVPCPNKCGVEFPLRNATDHRSQCPLEILDCCFAAAGCGVKRSRAEMPGHSTGTSVMADHMALMATHLRSLGTDMKSIQDEVQSLKRSRLNPDDLIDDSASQIPQSAQRPLPAAELSALRMPDDPAAQRVDLPVPTAVRAAAERPDVGSTWAPSITILKPGRVLV